MVTLNNNMKIYQTKTRRLSGTNFHEVHEKARNFYKQIKKRTKRRPYVRSVYFKRDKIFLELFWKHLYEKQNWRDRMRRLKYFLCAIELIQKSRLEPISKENPNKNSEIFHRFIGVTPDGDQFCIQIKENKRTDQKLLISIFPFY